MTSDIRKTEDCNLRESIEEAFGNKEGDFGEALSASGEWVLIDRQNKDNNSNAVQIDFAHVT